MTAMMTEPTRSPSTFVDIGTKNISESTKPMNIASPPMRGMGWSCTRRLSLGTSIAPTFSAKRLTGGVMTYATSSDTANASSIFIQSARPGNIKIYLQFVLLSQKGFSTRPTRLYTLRRVLEAT